MAYLERIQIPHSQPLSFDETEQASRVPFSPLEWSIIRLARVDGLSTLRAPGLLRRGYNWLIGRVGSPKLANERLEALRRIAVLTWHFGFSIPGDDVAEFFAAGFSPDQYELLVSRVHAAAGSTNQKISSEVFA